MLIFTSDQACQKVITSGLVDTYKRIVVTGGYNEYNRSNDTLTPITGSNITVLIDIHVDMIINIHVHIM